MHEYKNSENRYSAKIHFSYGIGEFMEGLFISAFTVRVLYFYENELLLAIVWISLALGIYGVWNMVNDPLLGVIVNKYSKNNQKTKVKTITYKIGVFTFGIIYFLIFLIPFRDQLSMFLWLLITICSFELFYTLWQISYISLFPIKFKTNEERIKVSAIMSFWGVLGISLGIIIPPLYIQYGNVESYAIASIVLLTIGFIMALFSLIGVKEEGNFQNDSLQLIKGGTSFKSLISIIKNKNNLIYLIVNMIHITVTVLILSSTSYYVKYILKSNDILLETYLSVSFISGVLVSIPLWLKVSKKIGNRNGFLLGIFFTSSSLCFFLFISSFLSSLFAIFFVGFGISCIYIVNYPLFASLMDRDEGKEEIFVGNRNFFAELSTIIQAIVFAIVHQITFYKPGATTQTPLALWGIRVIMALIPIILYSIGFLLLWKVFEKESIKK